MDIESVERLLRQGKNPREVAQTLGYSRRKVKEIAKRMKRDKREKRLKYSAGLIGILFFLGLVGVEGYKLFRDPTAHEMNVNIVRCADGLTISSATRSWLIEQEQLMGQGLEEDIVLLQTLTDKLNQVLQPYTTLPEVKQLEQQFGGQMFPTIFSSFGGGTSKIVRKGKVEETRLPLHDPAKIEVVFYGRFAYRHSKIRERLLFYDGEWRALILAALNYADDRMFAAILAHELWHAKKHREGAASAIAHTLTDPWVDEELEAHALETEVLSEATKRSYTRRLGEIIRKYRKSSSVRRFLATLEPADLRYLDSLFQPGLSEESDMRSAQYLLDLCMTWLAQHYQGGELHRRKREVYRMLIQPQSGVK